MGAEAKRAPQYSALKDQILFGTSPEQKAVGQVALDRTLFPKIESIIPPGRSKRGISNDQYFQIWDDALNSIGTEIAISNMTAQPDRALTLAEVRLSAATINMRRVLAHGLSTQPDAEELDRQQERVLRASRHHTLSAAELMKLKGGDHPKIPQPDGGALLSHAMWQLRHSPKAIELFEADGMNEIEVAVRQVPNAKFVNQD